MKKIALVLVMVFAVSALFASPLVLGNFPSGRWMDRNYDAIWEFSPTNIRITSPDGHVYFDFSNKTINDFRFYLDGDSPAVTFSCPEAGRTYKFVIQRPENDLLMEFDRVNYGKYEVKMRRY